MEILYKKLVALCANPGIVEWFKSFLDMRHIETVISSVKSDAIRKQNEVSEGSPLSATLFIVAIIDINLFVKYSQVNGFMDDFFQTTALKDVNQATGFAE